MGTDQGKMGNVVGLALLGDAAGKKLAEIVPRVSAHLIHRLRLVH